MLYVLDAAVRVWICYGLLSSRIWDVSTLKLAVPIMLELYVNY